MKDYPIENKIYAAVIGHCEEMEHKGQYRGNGHHLAQRLCSMVAAGLLSKQQKKIYDALTKSPKSVKEISLEVKISSPQVSAQLGQIFRRTQLVSSKREGKNRLWFKY